MNVSEIREYLADFQKREFPKIVERELNVAESQKIISIIGPRRAGKTTVLFQKMHGLVKSGVNKEKIVYLNFEDPRLIEIGFKEIREIIKLQWQMYPLSMKGKMYVFIDEPQNINNWESAVRGLHDEGFMVFLTGSSSRLLSREIATSLRGRTLSYMLLPFSFREFLKMKNATFDTQRMGSKEKSLLLSMLDEYLEFGGFPEIILEKNPENKAKIISEYSNAIVYRDIVERHKIKNAMLVKWLISLASKSFSREFSVHKAYQTLKSRGIKASKNTLYSYVSMLEESVFMFLVPAFGHSVRKADFSINKAYLCDTGFTKLAETTKDIGPKMENVVFLELERRRKVLSSISYWKNPQKQEVDFVIKTGGKISQLIQVCKSLENADVNKREISAITKAAELLKCNNLLIITEDKYSTEEYAGKKIRFVPLWMWLLEGAKHI